MKTFKQQITVSDELVVGFALYLGWVEEMEITPEEFVNQKSKEYMQNFFLGFGRKLVEDQLAEAKNQLEQTIIKPVQDALTTEVVEE